jgi:beta-ureidopropionase / N-carbamoyl-L-amino-acid hydrolase
LVVLERLTINGDRLLGRIDQLAKIGQQPDGTIRRLAFTPEDQQARALVSVWMVEAGMSVRVDAAGNLIGRYSGLQPDLPALATGSHIDTVPSGGRYDGVLGVLAGIEVVRTLQEQNLHLNHPIEVIAFSDEESSMVGSRAIAGTVDVNEVAALASHLEAVGGAWLNLNTARRTQSEIAAFVELHVEQGCVLENLGKSIGIVEGVVGMRRYAIRIQGQANHAGTTPMHLRQDALIAGAKLVLAVQTMALQAPGEPVATVGSLNVAPNAANIVPGQVDLTVDLRDLSESCLDKMTATLMQAVEAIALETHTQISINPILQVQPSPAAPYIQSVIEQVCRQANLTYTPMPSRAGHDAMEMGRLTNMGMIFVPSQGGISHSGDEYTSPEQCFQGTRVLMHTLLELDRL